MSIKAIVFDMDGVLIDARHWHFEALQMSLGLFGFGISLEEHERRFDGLPTKTKLKMLSNECGLPSALHSFINKMKQIYTANIVESRLSPRADHVDALQRLKSEGYRLAVASNSIRSTIIHMMERSSLAKYFDFYLSNEDVAEPKPSPQIYLQAMNRLGVSSHETLILEDSPFGLKAARESEANVLQIRSVDDVNYTNIRRQIDLLNAADTQRAGSRFFRRAA